MIETDWFQYINTLKESCNNYGILGTSTTRPENSDVGKCDDVEEETEFCTKFPTKIVYSSQHLYHSAKCKSTKKYNE